MCPTDGKAQMQRVNFAVSSGLPSYLPVCLYICLGVEETNFGGK